MRLYPSDLGDHWHVLFVRRRTRRGARLTPRFPAADFAPRLGPLGRLWTRGLPVPRAVAARTLPDAAQETRRPVLVGFAVATALFAPALAGYASPDGNTSAGVLLSGAFGLSALWAGAVVVPRRRLVRLHVRPLSFDETDGLLRQVAPPVRPGGSVFAVLAGGLNRALRDRGGDSPSEATRAPTSLGELEVAFLTLVRDVLARPGPENASAERDLRDALRALGEAVAGLPHVPPVPTETIVLRQNASAIRARARGEDDEVVAASLARQADALEREADAADQTNVLARRTAFLRQELVAQTRALRAGLFAAAAQNTSTTTAPAQNPSALSSVAQAVEAVAGEAKALARARIELDEPDQFVPSLSPAPVAEVRLRQR